MKRIVFTLLLLFVSFELAFGDSNCTDEDITKITKCYRDAYGDTPILVAKLSAPFILRNVKKEDFKSICENKQKLNSCIEKSLLERCFNVEDIQNLPFCEFSEAFAKSVIAVFLETDYYCDKLFKLSDDDYNCFQEVISQSWKTCSFPFNASLNCESINKTFNCIVEDSYKKCGKVVGCFQQKSSALDRCNFDSFCNACDVISISNNPMNGICDDDNSEVKNIVKNRFSLLFH